MKPWAKIFFFFNDTATTEIYTLSLHDALPIFPVSSAQDSIARAFNWIDLALVPAFIVHPLIIMATMAAIHLYGLPVTALYGVITASAAFWIVIIIQVVLLGRRLRRD